MLMSCGQCRVMFIINMKPQNIYTSREQWRVMFIINLKTIEQINIYIYTG